MVAAVSSRPIAFCDVSVRACLSWIPGYLLAAVRIQFVHLRNGSSSYTAICSVSPELFYCFKCSCKLLHRNVESLVIKSIGLCELAYSRTLHRSKVQKCYNIIWDWICKLFILKINANYIRILRAIRFQFIQELTFFTSTTYFSKKSHHFYLQAKKWKSELCASDVGFLFYK